MQSPLTSVTRVLIILGGMCLALVAARWVNGAPAPAARPAAAALTSADMVGAWELTWCGSKGTCQLTRDGSYYETWGATIWQGVWEHTPPSTQFPGGRLRITEYPFKDDGTVGEPYTFIAILEPGKREGKLVGGGNFALRPMKAGKPDA